VVAGEKHHQHLRRRKVRQRIFFAIRRRQPEIRRHRANLQGKTHRVLLCMGPTLPRFSMAWKIFGAFFHAMENRPGSRRQATPA
jgi:hypothetical protein